MLRDDQPITNEISATIIERFRDFLKRNDKSEQWAARSLGVAASTLSQVLSGDYGADSEKHIRAIDKWVEMQLLKEAAPKPAGFARIGVAARIFAVAQYRRKFNGIGLVHGPAGIGKTITLQAIRAETPGSIYISITPAGMSKLGVYSALAEAVRMPGLVYTSAILERQLISLLKDTGRLILVDEVHRLEGRRKDEGLQALRTIHDLTKCPMVWAGMSNIATYIQNGISKFEPLDQLNSRIKLWLNLTEVITRADGGGGLYTINDIRKVIASSKLRLTPDGERYLMAMANEPGAGGLRTICESLLRFAADFVGEKPITAEILKSIRRQQMGVSAADVVDRSMEQREMQIARAG